MTTSELKRIMRLSWRLKVLQQGQWHVTQIFDSRGNFYLYFCKITKYYTVLVIWHHFHKLTFSLHVIHICMKNTKWADFLIIQAVDVTIKHESLKICCVVLTTPDHHSNGTAEQDPFGFNVPGHPRDTVKALLEVWVKNPPDRVLSQVFSADLYCSFMPARSV